MQIKSMTDAQLNRNTKSLVAIERKTLAQILDYLAEIQKRRSFADLGYGSLFNYCVKELGYSESAAYRRITALKIVSKNKKLKPIIDKGQINLSNLCELGKVKKLNHKIVKDACAKSTGDFKAQVMELTGQKIKRESLRRVSSEKYKLEIELSLEGRKNLEKIKGIKRENDYSQIVEAALEAYLCRVSPEHKKAKAENIVHQSITPALKAKLWKRAKGQCQFPGCDSLFQLEVEHIHPIARGGDNRLSNLTLLCRNHNLRAAIRTYGIRPGKS